MQLISLGGAWPIRKAVETDLAVLQAIRYRRSPMPLIGEPGPLQGMPCEIPAHEGTQRERMVVLVTDDNGGKMVTATVLLNGDLMTTYDASYYIGSGPMAILIGERERLVPRPDLLELAMQLPDHPLKPMFSEAREQLLESHDRAKSG